MPINVRGELGPGDVKTLAFNAPVTWNSTSVVYTAPSGINGFEVYRIILKLPAGTQPLTWVAQQNGVVIAGGSSLTIPSVGQGVIFEPSVITIGSAGQTVTISGATQTAGTALCSIVGVEY